MSDRVRVYQLARELGFSNKELIELLREVGVEVSSHASTIDEEMADLVREHVIAERQEEQQHERALLESLAEVKKPAVDAAVAEHQAENEAAADVLEEDLAEESEEELTELHLKPPITVRDLARGLRKKPNELIGELFTMNIFAAINQVIEPDVVEKICDRHGVSFIRERRERAKDKPKTTREPTSAKSRKPGKQLPRSPVVAFLGHVDHGKTSLQDYIRDTQVVEGEAGGITQHIGASVIHVEDDTVTFLDTPGHEAFTAMRARGANTTDIAVLVVAADDGVMPQTIEAINHAKAAKVPIIVAMNKMDLPSANPEAVLLGLQQNDLTPEEWGGDIGVVPVSAITGDGISDLLERILLEAEMLELTADPEAPCEGTVIEAQLEQGRGATANILVRNGTLRVGDIMLCGQHYGRAKALLDHLGKRIKEAGPSMPVKVLGLSGVPEAGDILVICDDEKEAKEIAEERQAEVRKGELGTERKTSLEDLFRQMSEEAREQLGLIVKTDVSGSLEAILDNVNNIQSDKIKIDIIHGGVGEITENDVVLAAASDAIVMGFHVRVMPGVNRIAKQRGVEIRLYSVIYELLEDLKEAMRGRLEPELRETPIGEAEIIQVFHISKTGKICGCQVNGGVVRVGSSAKVFRDGDQIYSGKVASLRRFKDDVREVRSGLECGIKLDNFEDFEVGDTIEIFEVTEVAAEL